MTTTYNDNPTRLTQHQDYSVSLRLRRHSDGTDTPSMDMVLHALETAALSFTHQAMTCEEGRGRMGDTAAHAPDYHKLAARYNALADQVRRALR